MADFLNKQYVEDRMNCISAHHITNPGDMEEALNDLKSGKYTLLIINLVLNKTMVLICVYIMP